MTTTSATRRPFVLLATVCILPWSPAYGEGMNTDKRTASLWYQAFSTKDAALLDRILDPNWVDIPAAPDQPPGPEGVKPLLTRLTTTFPELKRTMAYILQEGDKVVVRTALADSKRE